MIIYYYLFGLVASAVIGYKLCTDCIISNGYNYQPISEVELSTNSLDNKKNDDIVVDNKYRDWEMIDIDS